MQRFPRTKYLNHVATIRRELVEWLSEYRTMLLDENRYQYTPQQLTIADDRVPWLEALIEQLDRMDDLLAGGSGNS